MLFDQASYGEIATCAGRLEHARERCGNLWREEWDARDGALRNAYAEAASADTPEAWQQVCERARDLRTEMENTDGHETIYYVESVRLTDRIDKALHQARANPQNLIPRKELVELEETAVKAGKAAHDERDRTPFWQREKRRRLEEGERLASQTVVEINVLSNLTINVSDITIDIAGAAKKASETVVDKVSKIVGLANDTVKLLTDEKVRQAAREMWRAARRFTVATVKRFQTLKLPEPRFGIDDPRPVGSIAVLTGTPDREKVRWIVPGSGEVFTDIEGGPEMVVVPAGKFMMGSPEREPERQSSEGPQHKVTFAHPFAVSRHAVTRGQFAAFVDATGHKAAGDWRNPGFPQDDSHPVVRISWDDARAYAAWLEKMTSRPYRLLSEAEWEYAARAGTTTPFWWGSSITTAQVNYDGNYVYVFGSKGEYRRGTVPAGSFGPNPWGLYNIHGNVWEWCEDTWHGTYKRAPIDGSAWVSMGSASGRVVRGGSWNDVPGNLRSARRGRDAGEDGSSGFRLARTLRS